jgi:hypothetical protein
LAERASNKSENLDWIELLLEVPICEEKFRIAENILAPYLINIRRLSIIEAQAALMKWFLKCDSFDYMSSSKVNVDYFVMRTCLEAYRLKKKPKDLEYLKSHNRLYRKVIQLADSTI